MFFLLTLKIATGKISHDGVDTAQDSAWPVRLLDVYHLVADDADFESHSRLW